MRPTFVDQRAVNYVIDGLQKFYLHCAETKEFSAEEMINFMEPIFERAGYRNFDMSGSRKTHILIIHDGAVGDFISMSAAIRELRRCYPDAYIIMMVTPMAMNLAEVCPYVDELFPNPMPWDEIPSTFQRNIDHAKFLLRRKIDMVYAFTHFPSTNMLAYMSGAIHRVSFEFNYEDSVKIETGPVYATMPLVNFKAPLRLFGTHNIEKNLGLLDYALHLPLPNRDPEVWFTPGELSRVQITFSNHIADGEKIYALCMGGTRASKKWAAENYAELFKTIIESEPEVQIAIVGGGDADAYYAEVFKQHLGEEIVKAHVLDFTNQTSFRQSAAILSCCDMYIGNDTGTLHMAAAVKIPILAVHYFAADLEQADHTTIRGDYPYHVPAVVVQPKHALPECQGSTTHYGCNALNQPHCITQITTDTVYAAYEFLKQQIADNVNEAVFVS